MPATHQFRPHLSAPGPCRVTNHRGRPLDGRADISGFSTPACGGFILATKTLLREGNVAHLNFEGITLGPQLENGDYSLILVSDNGSGLGQSLYALRITGVIPEPGTVALVVMGVVALVVAGRRRKPTGLGVRR